jgi:hypothetical protein
MSEAEIRNLLIQYLTGGATLREVDAALTAVAWTPASSPDARDLANLIALRIDEFTSGACTEVELQMALRPLVTDYTVRASVGPAATGSPVVQSSRSQFVTTPIVFGRRPEVVPL